MSKQQGILRKFWGGCKSLISRSGRDAPAKKNVSQIYSEKAATYSPEKQQQLEDLCESLFENKELITTGKLKLLGLAKIKRKLGKMWEGLQPIVYAEVEAAMAKYMVPEDIFIRYQDDSYVILFADAGLEESQVKANLIAEEIKRRLFEHEEEELNNIGVEENVSLFVTRDLRKEKNFSDRMDIIFEDTDEEEVEVEVVKTPKVQEKKRKVPVEIPDAFEVDPFDTVSEEILKPVKKEETPCALEFSYVPLWDIKRNFMTTYLCVAHSDSVEEDPLDAHEQVFVNATPSEKAIMDLQVLNQVRQELDSMIREGRKFFIACPVHYDTMNRSESHAEYIMACQKIPEEHKRFLIFVLLELPAQTHAANIPKFSIPLSMHCSSMHAQVPLDSNVDFSLFRECRFDALGVRLKKAQGNEKELLEQLGEFTQKAKKALIKKTFILDVPSLSVTTSAVCANYDFLAGSAIHESVPKPGSAYHFKHESLFADLLEKP